MKPLHALLLTSVATAQGWLDVTPATPGPQAWSGDSTMCYDPVRNLTWLFKTGTGVSVYSWDGTSWLFAASLSMQIPAGLMSTWDASRQQVVVASNAMAPSTQVYQWDGSVMAPLTSVSQAVGVAYDYRRSRVCIVLRNGSVIEFDGANWITTIPVAPPPSGNSYHYDYSTQRVTLNGGANTLFEWTGTNWVQYWPQVEASGPGASMRQGTLYWTSTDWSTQPHTHVLWNRSFREIYTESHPFARRNHLITFDAARQRFIIHGGIAHHSGVPMSDTWELPMWSAPSFSTFGNGCAGSRGLLNLASQSGGGPHIGAPFTLQINNLPWSGPAFMFLGLSDQTYGGTALPFNLASLGAPACNLYVSGDGLYSVPNILGVGIWSFVPPNLPGLTFFNQAFAIDPAANSLGLTSSNAGRGAIGN